uniref:Gem nuclear organelle associated protein 4 n=2 Tax=Leptobrachium leishanense TaxID=445787 RepID=A0A8C5QQY4_9ANUR
MHVGLKAVNDLRRTRNMDFGSWNICEQTLVLQGAFLLAEKLVGPKTLLEAIKSDWLLIEKPVTDALKEISSGNGPQSDEWKKRTFALLWTKVLSCRPGLSMKSEEDIERKWKEDVFFPVGNLFPKINHTIFFELLKTTKSANIFADLLVALPTGFWIEEATLIVQHICEETSVEDVTFFLDLWWEIMKNNNQKDETTLLFSTVASSYLLQASNETSPSSKRFKPDPEYAPTPADSLLRVFLEGLRTIKQHIVHCKLKCYTVANLADVLCSSVIPEKTSESVPIWLYLEKLAAVVYFHSTTGKDHSLLDVIKEGERIVQSRSATSRFRLLRGAQHFGLDMLKDLLLQWNDELQNYMDDGKEIGYEIYRMADSLYSLHKMLIASENTETFPEEQRGSALELAQCISRLQEKTSNILLQSTLSDGEMIASIAMNIIDERLHRYEEVCSVFASETTWAFSGAWMNCFRKNKVYFRVPDLIVSLLETVLKVVSTQKSIDMKEIRRATDVILTLFTELSLTDKDKVLSRVLSLWGNEGLLHSLNAFTDNFQEELNLTFNQISQSTADYNASKAVSRVARLALLHPEAVINKACHFAVVNDGAHVFLGKILTSLPALKFKGTKSAENSVSLLTHCLINTCWGKLSSPKEESQFLSLLTYLMEPSETSDNTITTSLLQPEEVVRTFVLPYILDESAHVELCLRILHKAVCIPTTKEPFSRHWLVSCSPFPLLLSLCKLLNSYTKYWQPSDKPYCLTLGCKELIIDLLKLVCNAIIPEAEHAIETWNKSLFWLHRKMEHLDWVVCLRLQPIYGEHFKKEVPASLFEMCNLSENEWTPVDFPEYGLGTGLLAWLECCCISVEMKDHMLSLLSVNTQDPEEVNLFSKGFLVAMIQVLPWCCSTECKLLIQVVSELLKRQVLHVPYTLEYVQHMPLLNLRPFAYNLQFSILLLRGFQLLCSSSCSEWLSHEGHKHIAWLYSSCVSDMLDTVKQTLSRCNHQLQQEGKDTDYVQEVLFIYTQVFCHVLHIIAMMPDNTCEPLYILSLEILTLYGTLRPADTSTNSLLRRANEKHFLKSITENVSDDHHRATLMQKIGKI